MKHVGLVQGLNNVKLGFSEKSWDIRTWDFLYELRLNFELMLDSL
jgi:hypothetical protein